MSAIKMDELTLSVASAFGVEGITKNEITALGYPDCKAVDGHVYFTGDESAIARCNIFLRTADRVDILLTKGIAESFDMLFELVKQIDWRRYLSADAKIVVNGKCVRSKLFAISACQGIVKKAIVTAMQQQFHIVSVPESGALYAVDFAIVDNVASIFLNTGGAGLNKRGYRKQVGNAPLKETLASAMLHVARFDGERPLLDCFCGSGTIPIEAAQMALHIPPGLYRSFSFCGWNTFNQSCYQAAVEEGESGILRDKKLSIFASDIDSSAINLAAVHAKLAKVDKYIRFSVTDMRSLDAPASGGKIVTNPPYGERLLTEKQTAALYKDFRTTCDRLSDWQLYLITAAEFFEKSFGKRADKTRKLFNGNLPCRIYMYTGRK